VKYLVEVIVTFAIFFTPVFYDVSMFGKWAGIFLLNPVAPILEGIAACVVHQRAPDIMWILYSAAVSLAIFACAFAFFTKLEPLFAERI
jgi:ABC-type polysaccharide/polyol phosphate export permease